jgi:hypothetical protein
MIREATKSWQRTPSTFTAPKYSALNSEMYRVADMPAAAASWGAEATRVRSRTYSPVLFTQLRSKDSTPMSRR